MSLDPYYIVKDILTNAQRFSGCESLLLEPSRVARLPIAETAYKALGRVCVDRVDRLDVVSGGV
jgi:hypothetical protein